MRTRYFALASLLILTTGCGPTVQATRPRVAPTATRDDVGVIDRLTSAAAQEHSTAPQVAVVVITARPPAHGFAVFSLPDARRLWDTTQAVDARPWVVGDLVLSHQGSELIAWDAQSGHE